MSLLPAISARTNRNARAVSIAAAMITAVDTRLAGRSFGTAGAMFTGYNTSTFASTRNASCWCSDLPGITAISPWNSEDAYRHGGVLIAPDVVLYSDHSDTDFANGTVFSFVTLDNTVVTRTQAANSQIGSTDIRIGKLDSDVPGSIRPALVLSPSDFAGLQSVIAAGVRVPILSTDQEEKALVRDSSSLAENAIFRIPIDAARIGFYENLVGGDSGSTGAWIYGSDLVLACAWQGGLGGSGPSVHYYRNEINAAMTALGSAYQLTELTL
jgi:hypothetical protein